MKTVCRLEIDNDPDHVFHWISDPERAKLWMTSVSQTEILNRTPNMIGTTFRETVEENGRGTELQGVVTDYQPGRLMAFHLGGRYDVVDVEYRLDDVGGRTRLIQEATIRFRGLLGVASFLLRPLFKRKIIAQSRQELARLKEFCEKGQ